MRCDYCGAQTEGVALCTTCKAFLAYLLEFVPIWFRNLSRWRPSTKAGDRRSKKVEKLVDQLAGILETGHTFGRPSSLDVATSVDRIGELLDETHADFVGWLRALADDRPQLEPVIARILTFDEERTVRLACALLTKRIDTLTTLPWVRDLMVGVVEAEKNLRIQTERSIPGWYAGECRRCHSKTFVVPGMTWVTCQGCGATTAARDHLDVILDEARDWVARPKALAEALVALVDTEQSVSRLHERIKKWGTREPTKVTAVRPKRRAHVYDMDVDAIVVGVEEYGYARYRFGDVFDTLMKEGSTTSAGVVLSRLADVRRPH